MYSNSNGLQIKLANSAFPSKTFDMVEKFKNYMNIAFKCQIQSLDYKNNAGKSKTVINDLVASSTNGKIKDLLSDIDPSTACIHSQLYLLLR